MKQQLLALEPYVSGYRTDTAEMMLLNGQEDEAIERFQQQGNADDLLNLVRIYAARGQLNEAADLLLEIPKRTRDVPTEVVVEPARLLRMAPVAVTSPQNLADLGECIWRALGPTSN
jgi:hypothetical protein